MWGANAPHCFNPIECEDSAARMCRKGAEKNSPPHVLFSLLNRPKRFTLLLQDATCDSVVMDHNSKTPNEIWS